jgi:hypothetical protein
MGDDRTLRLAVATSVLALVTACTSTVAGTAAPADPPAAAPETAAPGVIPSPEPGTEGTTVEAHRMASVATLIEPLVPDRPFSCYPFGPSDTPDEVESLYFAPDTVASVLSRSGFVVAWTQCQAASAEEATVIVLSEVSDPDTARRILPELVEATSDADQRPVTLPGGQPGGLTALGDREVVQAWAAVGRVVASVFHVTATGDAVPEAGRVMDDQVALLRGFVPTPQERLGTLTIDPEGIRDLVVELPGVLHRATGTYDLEGYLRFALDPTREREVLAANGFAGMYSRITDPDAGGTGYGVSVFRFPDSARTNTVYTAFAELEGAEFETTSFTLPSIPDAPCFSFGSRSGDGTFTQRCYVGFGRYLASVDVSNLAAPDDTAEMGRLLPLQRDLIDG